MITFLICVVYNFFVSYTKIKELSDITLGLITPNFITFPFTLSLGQKDKSWELKNRFATKKNEKNLSTPLTGERVDLKIILHFSSLLLQYLQTSDNKVSVCARKPFPYKCKMLKYLDIRGSMDFNMLEHRNQTIKRKYEKNNQPNLKYQSTWIFKKF